jgi:two-component system phosphate regulon sensor histidine kinase PhoR
VVGFLNVDSDLPGAFSHETLQRLQALADHASIAIHNAELYSESNRQAQELSTLVQSAAMVSSSLDVTLVLEELCKQMAHLVGVEGCAISSYDQAAMTVSLMGYYREDITPFEPVWHMPSNLRDFPVTLRVLQQNIVVQIHANDPQADPAELVQMNRADVKTLLKMPLVAQDVTLGLVELESVDAGRVFSPREISLLQTLGANAANAIQHARLFKQLQEYAGMLEQRVEERTGELRSAKEHIESILASIPDAIFVLDDAYQPIRSNQAGDSLILNAQADQLNLFEPEFLTKLRSGQLRPEASILATRGRFYQALSSPFPVQPGQEGLVVVFRDVTRFRELDEIKTHFVSDVSHELRTPLTNLLLYLDLLTTTQDPEKGNAYITTLQRETQRLSFLIEDLLTISRLEAGRMTITIQPSDVNRLISDLAADRMMLASSSQLKLAFVPEKGLPLALTDASLLTQGVSNLLTNAINYTPAGGSVTLSTHLRTDDGDSWVTIDISDTGVGIPLEEQTRIFERFYRGSASRKTGAAGTGLGLAIAQDIAQRVDGKLSMQSQPGQGSTFTFWLKAVL